MGEALRLLTDEQMRAFITQGYLILQTDFSQEFHQQLLEQLENVYQKEGNPGNNLLPRVRELQKVFDSPIIKGALTSVLGPEYTMHTHRYGHLNSTPKPVNWHKDSYWGNDRLRNHMPWWAMVMYFPQDTPLELGPTGVMPGTQNYDSRTFEGDEHDYEAKASGKVGHFVLLHYDIWHRATLNTLGTRRFMLKFEFTRTQAPKAPSWNAVDPVWRSPKTLAEPIMRHDLLWKQTWDWLSGKTGSLADRASVEASSESSAEISVLINQLKEQDAKTRVEAANELGLEGAKTFSVEAVNALSEALSDSFEPVRMNAAYGLAAMGSPGIEALLRGLHHEDANVSKVAAYGLSAAGEPAVDGLIAALNSGRDEVAAHAAFALGELGKLAGKAAPALVNRVGHSSVFVRRTVVQTLGTVITEEYSEMIITALCEALQDEDYQVRFWTGLALARCGSMADTAVPNLVAALDDENRYVRGHAALALRYIDTEESRNILIDYLFASRWCPITTPQNEWYP